MAIWQAAFGGSIPAGAKPAGTESTGESLYVARADVPGGGKQLGKVRSGFGAAYIPFAGNEQAFGSYEVLMDPSIYFPSIPGAPSGIGFENYPAETRGFVPPQYPNGWGYAFATDAVEPRAILCGHEESGSPLFCAVVSYEGGVQPGKVGLGLGGANISFAGVEIPGLNPYGVLCDESFGWELGSGTTPVPEGCVQCGYDDDGAPLYLARVVNFSWLAGDPPSSFPAGPTGLQLGKIRADGWGFQGACIPYAGQEHKVTDYQVLTAPSPPAGPGAQLNWVSASNGSVPDKALVFGCEGDGTPLFAARAFYGSGQHVGKVRHGFQGAYIPYEGNEISVAEYEVLVVP